MAAKIISIGATQHIDLFKTRLDHDLELLEIKGLKLHLEEKPAGKFTILSCRIAGNGKSDRTGEDTQVFLKHYMANMISDIILEHWEYTLLESIIRENYYYFGLEERKMIYDYALGHINREAGSNAGPGRWKTRKSAIVQKIADYLAQNNHIIVDGFIRFRLKEYIGELREATDKAVDDYLMEREYREFIQLLQYYVDVQEPRLEEVHVLIRAGGNYNLYDGQMLPVKGDRLDGYIAGLLENETGFEDILVSVLINIAPTKITFHYQEENTQLALETIKSIFSGRVSDCRGCPLCKQ